MEKITLYVSFLIIFFLLELVYLRLANHFKINAIPSQRGSHNQVTITGGGIIFPIACFAFFLTSQFQYPFFICGLIMVAFISFIDDIKEASIKIRLLIQLLAVFLMFMEFDLYSNELLIIVFILSTTIIFINAYNFMDGINGITVVYSLVQFFTFYYINHFKVHFIDENLLIIVSIGLLVFKYFNFRIKARCFAGDVGSISIAFTVCFCLLKLIWQTQNLLFINFLLIYCLDAGSSFVFRWIKGENVFQPHRKHFYQFLANGLKWHHISVAVVFGLAQLIINIFIIYNYNLTDNDYNLYNSLLLMLIATGLFVSMRIKLEGKSLYMKTNTAL